MGQQALLWAALAEGSSTIAGLAARRDHALLAAALGELGVTIARSGDLYQVEGRGLTGLKMPRGALYAGDSVSTLELLVALLAGQRFGTRIEVDAALGERSLRTLILPLRERGAHVAGRRERSEQETDAQRPPVAVAPLLEGEPLGDVEIAIPTGDPATKLGLLVSGLYTRGVTAISESMLSRDHAERALMALGAPIQTAAGMTLLDTSDGAPAWPGFAWHIPGDFTLASFVLAAVSAIEGSDVVLRGVGLNPLRTGLLGALGRTGARVVVQPKGDQAGNEPVGDLRVQSARIARLAIGGERALGLVDDLPALLALCAASRERVSLRDVGVLRLQRPDVLKLAVELLARFGVSCTVYEDGLEIDPPERLIGAEVGLDMPPLHALLGCILGLSADGDTLIAGSERLDAHFPGLVDTLIALGGSIEREEHHDA